MKRYKRKDQSGSKVRFIEVQRTIANVGTIYQCFYLEQVKAWMLFYGEHYIEIHRDFHLVGPPLIAYLFAKS